MVTCAIIGIVFVIVGMVALVVAARFDGPRLERERQLRRRRLLRWGKFVSLDDLRHGLYSVKEVVSYARRTGTEVWVVLDSDLRIDEERDIISNGLCIDAPSVSSRDIENLCDLFQCHHSDIGRIEHSE